MIFEDKDNGYGELLMMDLGNSFGFI